MIMEKNIRTRTKKCKHPNIYWDADVMTMIANPKVNGVCPDCNANFRISRDEYERRFGG
jgi:hypothetical protein